MSAELMMFLLWVGGMVLVLLYLVCVESKRRWPDDEPLVRLGRLLERHHG